MTTPVKKIDQLSTMMKAGKWEKAIKFAARFPRLDKHRNIILTASAALMSPGLYRGMGRDPQMLVAAGIEALKERYPNHF